MPNRSHARQLAADALERGEPLAWFETLYKESDGSTERIPWADQHPNPHLTQWLSNKQVSKPGRALVVGCGLGDDSEYLAKLGFQTTAFDISDSCIQWCKRRFPDSSVEYIVGDLLDPNAAWKGYFDLIVEIYTLQVLPNDLQRQAAAQLSDLLSPRGLLLIVARGRNPEDSPGQMPWPLTRADLEPFKEHGLQEVQFEDFVDDEDPPVRRFRVEYQRPDGTP